MSNEEQVILRKILKRIQVDLSDEFDRNFTRQSFFSKPWQRRKSPVSGSRSGHLLVDSGELRRSIQGSTINGDTLTFSSDLPYAKLHNEGGEIKVTARMKRYFWARYLETQKRFGRKKDGSIRKTKGNVQVSSMAAFWKHMALMKVGSTIHIPARPFLANSPEVENIIRQHVDEGMKEYIDNINWTK